MSLLLDSPVDSPVRGLLRSVVGVSAARVYSLGVSAAMIMVVARWLGPAGQGTMAASTAWATLFATLGSLSLGQVAVHRATVRRGEAWLGDTMGTLLLFDVIVTAGCWIVAAAIYAVTNGRTFGRIPPSALAVGLLIVPFLVWELYGGNLLTATGKIETYNRAQVIGRSVGIVLFLLCWLLRLGVVAAIAVAVISQAVVASIGVRELWRLAGRVQATLREARALLKGAAQLHVNTISNVVLTTLGVLIVNRYCSLAETGWYQFSASLLNVMAVIPLAISTVLFAMVAQNGPRAAWATQRKIMLWLMLFMIASAAVAAVAAPLAIPLVVGAKYIPAVHLFQLSLLAIPGMTAAGVMASQWIGRGYFWQMSAMSVVFSALHLTITLLLVKRYGMYGAVYANVISSGIALVSNAVFAFLCEKDLHEAAA
ncbi:MAG TPA: lipopolysaccharide biosynthesis protein [Thermoanaerobaculia bacterium]|nr:lipopolysaccharide biosynthesis protein [Thermoanaerobaculia bacterium]